MLAVLKAGGAFVPLDPTHPIARIQGLVQAVEAKILICSPGHASRLSSAVEAVVPLAEEELVALAACLLSACASVGNVALKNETSETIDRRAQGKTQKILFYT